MMDSVINITETEWESDINCRNDTRFSMEGSLFKKAEWETSSKTLDASSTRTNRFVVMISKTIVDPL